MRVSQVMAGPPLIELRKVSRVYGSGEAAIRALDQIDLAIGAHEFLAIMGPSGSGKSTAMNIIGCLDVPSSGEYLFQGIPTSGFSQNQRTLLRRHMLGFVFHGFNLLPRTSALENVELPLVYRRISAKEMHERALAALAAVGLSDRAKHYPRQLSGGQEQRVGIARAIVTDPTLLLCDEPTGDLDRKSGDEVLDLLQALNKQHGKTIVMVTHDPHADARANRTLHLEKGRLEREVK